ncbi:MAG: response regulator [Fimbriimonas sp.]|nr:response regulator [Fimbriimonas sp.]
MNAALEQHALELEEATLEAERANGAKSEFLSRMSHELRTPLNAILGFAQILGMQTTDPGILDSAAAILEAGHHLLGLVNEILDIARIESGRLDCSLESTSVQSCVRGAVDLVRQDALSRKIEIRVDRAIDTYYVLADRKRLVQIFANLLSNAVKYNKDAGSVTVQCGKCDAGTCRIRVRDTGRGLPQNAEEWLFKPFERGPDRAVPGTGLGLALSRSLAGLMGGNLVCETSDSSGTAFIVEMTTAPRPADENLHSDTLHRAHSNALPDPLDIVLIEDDPASARLLKKFFAPFETVNLRISDSGDDGLRSIQAKRPDAILLDLNLPDLSGIEILKQMQASNDTCDIPVIVLTADATDAMMEIALREGAAGYLTKPIAFEALTSVLRRETTRSKP